MIPDVEYELFDDFHARAAKHGRAARRRDRSMPGRRLGSELRRRAAGTWLRELDAPLGAEFVFAAARTNAVTSAVRPLRERLVSGGAVRAPGRSGRIDPIFPLSAPDRRMGAVTPRSRAAEGAGGRRGPAAGARGGRVNGSREGVDDLAGRDLEGHARAMPPSGWSATAAHIVTWRVAAGFSIGRWLKSGRFGWSMGLNVNGEAA